jgi:hypothetical protein
MWLSSFRFNLFVSALTASEIIHEYTRLINQIGVFYVILMIYAMGDGPHFNWSYAIIKMHYNHYINYSFILSHTYMKRYNIEFFFLQLELTIEICLCSSVYFLTEKNYRYIILH